MSAEATATAAALPTDAAAAASALTAPTPGSLPLDYAATDPKEIGTAKVAHFLGILGILGTGIWYLVKKNEAGPFAKDQMKEAFNFHLLVFCVQVVLNILGAVVAAVVGPLAIVFSLVTMVVGIGALVLSIMNGLKAAKGQVARYPARLSVLK